MLASLVFGVLSQVLSLFLPQGLCICHSPRNLFLQSYKEAGVHGEERGTCSTSVVYHLVVLVLWLQKQTTDKIPKTFLNQEPNNLNPQLIGLKY
jgi:hypothetical protein